MKKALISQKFNDLSNDEILEERKKAVKFLKEEGYQPVYESFYDELNELKRMQYSDHRKPELYYLSFRLKIMADCDAVYFCNGWEYDIECRMEHEASIMYGLRTLYAS